MATVPSPSHPRLASARTAGALTGGLGVRPILVGFALLQIVAVLAAVPLAWHLVGEAATSQASFRAGLAADHVRSLIRSVAADLDAVTAEAQLLSPRSPTEFRDLLGKRDVFERLVDRQRRTAIIDVLSIFSIDGALINFTRQFPPLPINVADRDFFRAHFAGNGLALQISAPVRNRGSGAWTFFLSRAIRSPTGGIVGLVVAGINISRLADEFHAFDSGAVQSISLLRSDGVLLTRAQSANAGSTPAMSTLPVPGTPLSDLADRDGSFLDTGIFARRLVSAKPVADLPLRLEVIDRVSLWPIESPVQSLLLVVGLGPAIVMLAMLFVVWFGQRRQRLGTASRHAEIGSDPRVPPPGAIAPAALEQSGLS